MKTTLEKWRAETAAAATEFESRWTWAALRRVDPDVARRLHEQRGLFDKACVTGMVSEIESHGAALVRGYGVAVTRLAGEPDDAYVLGHDVASGLTVAIGEQRAAVDRVREVHGERVVWLTPDEVARMLAGVEAFKFVGAVKRMFPGAEVIDRYPDEPGEAA